MHARGTVQISRKTIDVRCLHCGTNYEVTWKTPARDTGSAECQECGLRMLEWRDSPIPSIRRKDSYS